MRHQAHHLHQLQANFVQPLLECTDLSRRWRERGGKTVPQMIEEMAQTIVEIRLRWQLFALHKEFALVNVPPVDY